MDKQDAALIVQLAQWGSSMGLEDAMQALWSDDFDPEAASVDDVRVARVLTFGETIGTLVVECGSCRARSRLGYLDLARRSLPFALWTPWRRHSRLARCPACEQRTWLAARWFD